MKKVIMVILDGFGLSDSEYGNAIKQSTLDCYNELFAEYPHAVLQASGDYVGLPDDQFGNSEVGHLTIGAGRKIKQDITICNEVLGSTLIEKNEMLIEFLNSIKENDGTLHLMGLVSDGGVHSDIKYIKNLLKHLSALNIVNKVYFHAITDGRDTGTTTGITYIEDLENTMKEVGLGKIGTICGRYYAMDRDNKWERTKIYADLILKGKGANLRSYKSGINECYKRKITDEFIPPILIEEKAIIKENDGLLWLNFRGDRARQILTVLKDEDFNEFKVNVPNIDVITLLDVPNTKNLRALIPQEEEIYTMGIYLSDLGLRQARIAETEKYAHVTYFFNGGDKTKLKGCDNFLIPSPKVATYDETPAMSVEDVTKQAIKCIEKDYDFILVNMANPDMLGHTGNLEATKQGLEIVDKCLAKIVEAVDDNFYKLIVTADHGNCDEMLGKNGEVLTTHSMNPVPFIIRDKHVSLKHKGDITQIAPTILKYMDIAIPKDMKETKTLFVEEE